MLGAEVRTLEQHVMARTCKFSRKAKSPPHAAIGQPDRIAAAAGSFVMAENDQRAATQRVTEPIRDRPDPTVPFL